MNPQREALSAARTAAAVVVLVVVVLGAAYVGPSMLAVSSTRSTTSQTASNPDTSDLAVTLLPLFGNFSQMQLQETVLRGPQGGNQPPPQQVTFSYLVLGKFALDSTQHTKVQFSQAGSPHNVIAWFNPKGGIDRVDILGDINYTGSGAHNIPAVQVYVNAFRVLTLMANNATLISILSKTSEGMTSIGPSQLDVTTYQLAVPTHPYKSLAAKYGTIPGANARILVYYDEKMTDGSETTIEVLSLTK